MAILRGTCSLQLVTVFAMINTARTFSSPHIVFGAARYFSNLHRLNPATEARPGKARGTSASAQNWWSAPNCCRGTARALRSIPKLRGGGRSFTTAMSDAAVNAPEEETLVQYVILRRDLAEQGWPTGSIVAQGCHVVTKLLWEMRDEENVIKYCADINNMRKVVLGARDEKVLRKVADKLEENGVKYRIWIEQPEDYATAIAIMPYPKSVVAPHLKKLSLLK